MWLLKKMFWLSKDVVAQQYVVDLDVVAYWLSEMMQFLKDVVA